MRKILRASSFLILTLFWQVGRAQPLHWRSMPADRTASAARLGDPGLRRSLLRSHLLIQFRDPVIQFRDSALGDQTGLLTQRGITVLGYVPDNGWVVSAPDGTDFTAVNLHWYGRLLPQDKLSPQLALGPSNFWIVEFHRDVQNSDARAIALASGLSLLDHPALLPYHLLVSGTLAQLRNVADWDEVEYIFPASFELIHGAAVHPCAGGLISRADAAAATVPQSVPTIGDGWDGPGLGSAALVYAFKTTTAKLPADSVQSEIARAFAEWNKVVQVSFTPATNVSGPKTITVLFATGAHGDGYAFDGPGGMLAHSFYPAPPNPEPIAGDMHLDDSENWHIGADIDLFSVALHEAGHTLGLGHSDNPNDVMYPYYKQVTALAAGDLQAILTLYAAQDGSQPPTTPAPTPPPPVTSAAATISIQSPVTSSTYATTAAGVSLSGTAADAGGIASITWTNSLGGSGTASGTANWSSGPIALQPGINLLSATVHGQDGKTQTAQLQVTYTAPPVSFVPDTTAPSLQINSPAASMYDTSALSIVVNGTASDNVGVAGIAWTSSTAGAGTASGTTQWSTSSIPLLAGLNVITITATDTAGNSSWRVVQVNCRPTTAGVGTR